MRALAFSLVAATVLAACAVTPPAASPYAGTVWTLDRYVGADGSVTRGTGEERLTFGADGNVQIASCNLCNGRFRVQGDVLTVGEPLACTRRACLGGQMELERFFTGPVRLDRDGPVLTAEVPGLGGPALLVFTADTVAETGAAP